MLIDESKVLKGLGSDRELFAEVLELFLQDSDRLLRDVRSAIDRKDPAALRSSAHALKGSIANLSSGSAYECAAELERIGKNGDCSSAPERITKLEQALRELQSAASHTLRKHSTIRGKKMSGASGAA